LFALRYIIYWK